MPYWVFVVVGALIWVSYSKTHLAAWERADLNSCVCVLLQVLGAYRWSERPKYLYRSECSHSLGNGNRELWLVPPVQGCQLAENSTWCSRTTPLHLIGSSMSTTCLHILSTKRSIFDHGSWYTYPCRTHQISGQPSVGKAKWQIRNPQIRQPPWVGLPQLLPGCTATASVSFWKSHKDVRKPSKCNSFRVKLWCVKTITLSAPMFNAWNFSSVC